MFSRFFPGRPSGKDYSARPNTFARLYYTRSATIINMFLRILALIRAFFARLRIPRSPASHTNASDVRARARVKLRGYVRARVPERVPERAQKSAKNAS